MFSSLTEAERQSFLKQNYDSFIPGYTGHCPTLKFHYGRCYGTKTKEILKDIRNRRLQETPRERYREQDYKSQVLQPITKSKGQFRDYALDYKCRAPRYITGYTGFVPTLNFRYGKSYGKAVDDSMCEYSSNIQRRIQTAEEEVNRMFRAKSAPRMTSIRSQDEVQRSLNEYIDKNKFKARKISPEDPPIAGYTGHIPRVKGNEESLSQRYNTVVKRGLTLLREERERMKRMSKAQNQLIGVLEDCERSQK